MEPIDYRNATWSQIQDTLQGKRLEALEAWRVAGPGTTRDIAKRSGIDILTFRPRTTELYQLGLIALVNEDEPAKEGIYRALSNDEALSLFHRRCKEARQEIQLSLI